MPRYDLECRECRSLTIIYLLAAFALNDVETIKCEFCGMSSLKIVGFNRDSENRVQELHSQIRTLDSKKKPYDPSKH